MKSIDDRLHFATVVIAIVGIWCVTCHAQSLETTFEVSDMVFSVDISRDGSLVGVGSGSSDSQSLMIFDVGKRARSWSAVGGQWVRDVAFSPDQKWLVAGSDSGLRVWNAQKKSAAMVLHSPENSLPEVKHLSLSPKGRFLAASRGSHIEIWDFPRRKILRSIKTSGGGAVAFSPDEGQLAIAGYNSRLMVSDVPSGAKLGEIHADSGILLDVVYSPDGRTLYTCSEGRAKAFSVEQAAEKVILAPKLVLAGGLSVDVAPNGKWVASGGYTGEVRISDSTSGQRIASLPVGNPRDPVYAVKFSADSEWLVVGGMLGKGPERTGIVQIWDIQGLIEE